MRLSKRSRIGTADFLWNAGSLNPPGKLILPLWLFYGNHVFDTPTRNRCKKYLREIKLKSEEPLPGRRFLAQWKDDFGNALISLHKRDFITVNAPLHRYDVSNK